MSDPIDRAGDKAWLGMHRATGLRADAFHQRARHRGKLSLPRILLVAEVLAVVDEKR